MTDDDREDLEKKLARLQDAYDALERDRRMWEAAVFRLRDQLWATEQTNAVLARLMPGNTTAPKEAHIRLERLKSVFALSLSDEALAALRADDEAVWSYVDNAMRELVKQSAGR
jgi:chromosome segregation ATPase